jgi:hypothetical protein
VTREERLKNTFFELSSCAFTLSAVAVVWALNGKLSLAKMLSGANAFKISGYKLKPEDRMQCYMPCRRRNNNSPATG